MFKQLISIIAAIGLLLPFASHALSPVAGDLIKGESFSSVYYLASDGKRWVFPNEAVFFSWYENFDNVKTISDENLASLPLGRNITMRPGVKLVKITTDSKVYGVSNPSTLQWIKTEEIAKTLYGDDWAKEVIDIPDTFFTSYVMGAPIDTAIDFAPFNWNGGTKANLERIKWAFNSIDELIRAKQLKWKPDALCWTFDLERCRVETGMQDISGEKRLLPDYRLLYVTLAGEVDGVDQFKLEANLVNPFWKHPSDWESLLQ